jgi:hypothetical protein
VRDDTSGEWLILLPSFLICRGRHFREWLILLPSLLIWGRRHFREWLILLPSLLLCGGPHFREWLILLPSLLLSGGRHFREWLILLHLRLVQSLLMLGRWPSTSRPVTHFPQRDGSLERSLRDILSEILLSCSLNIISLPRHSCSFMPRFRMPSLVSGCARRPPFRGSFHNVVVVGSLMSLALPRCRNCAKDQPLSASGQRLTSAETRHHPGSVSFAVGGVLQQDSGPHIKPPVLRHIPFRPLRNYSCPAPNLTSCFASKSVSKKRIHHLTNCKKRNRKTSVNI